MPVWSRNGHEVFYRTEDQRIMVANYKVTGNSFVSDKPHAVAALDWEQDRKKKYPVTFKLGIYALARASTRSS